ncbi:MAG: hypothetical protein KUG77_30005 [Nannocystaceae bacterium]|nr:hypothetical protein [Nannocystaceae bacterium]
MHRSYSFAALLAVFLTTWFAPSPTLACKCGLPPTPVVTYPVFDDPQQLERVEERIWIECDRKACRLRARLVVRNPAGTEVRTTAHFARSHAGTFELAVDGVRRGLTIPASRSPELRESLDARVPYGNVGELETSHVEIQIGAGASMTIEIEASLDVGRWSCGCGDWGMRGRHLVVTPESYTRQLAFVRVSELPSREGAVLMASVTAPFRESVTVSSFRGEGDWRDSVELFSTRNATRPETVVLEGRDAEVLFVDLDSFVDAHALLGGPRPVPKRH